VRRWVERLYASLRPGPSDRSLERELASHLALLEDKFQRDGLTPANAALAARRALGGLGRVTEQYRDQRTFPWLEKARRDVRYAARRATRVDPLVALRRE
jgi:hypothetical protein